MVSCGPMAFALSAALSRRLVKNASAMCEGEDEPKQYDRDILHGLSCRWWLGAMTTKEFNELGSVMMVLRDLWEIEERDFFTR